MPGLFSRLKSKDGAKSKKKNAMNDLAHSLPAKPQWDDAWTRKSVEPEEIHDLIRCCTEELKSRGLDHPFLLLPFRPTSDPSAVRTFVRHFFDQSPTPRGEALKQELRLTEPMVISGVVKWCWSRLEGGVVGWDAYELFKVGEFDSNMARDSFKTFIPISIENGARQRIVFDFFDLMAAVAAHGKSNGFGGRKLSRMAAWWAFEYKDTGNGFDGGYNGWLSAADATSHLFFAYLRSLSPEKKPTGIELLPRSLQKLVQETEYPPQKPELMMTRTSRVVMIVDTVSPTPFALLRRANHFQYRDSDQGLQEFSEYDDPIQALTDECRRVLKSVSGANQSQVSNIKHSTSLRDASWSRFEDIGFSSALEEDEEDESAFAKKQIQGLKTMPTSGGQGLDRPTTPSWADFLSSGFVDDNPSRNNLLLPPDKVLPPIGPSPSTQTRQHSSQSHRPRLESDRDLEPGELASISIFDLDDAFWWVWMSSLAPEETAERKAAFGRCAVIETSIRSARWLVMEEMIAGAAPEPQEGAYIAEKKGFFSWTRRGKTLGRRKSTGKQALDRGEKSASTTGLNKGSLGSETHARVQAKAAQLRAAEIQSKQDSINTERRGRVDIDWNKTNSVATLQPNIVGEASSAMKWVKKYDKGAIKDAYMANSSAGRGLTLSRNPSEYTLGNFPDMNGSMRSPEIKVEEPIEKPLTPPPMTTAIPQRKPAPPSKGVFKAATASAPPSKPEAALSLQKKPVLHVEKQVLPHVEKEPVPHVERNIVPQVEKKPVPQVEKSPPPPPKDEEPVQAPVPVDASTPPPIPTVVETPQDPVHEPPSQLYQQPEPEPQLQPQAQQSAKAQEVPKSKKAAKESKGFRKLFSRKNRSSKLPDNAAADVNAMFRENQQTPEPAVQQEPTPAPTPDVAAQDETLTSPGPEASKGEDLSRVNTGDAAEATQEFSRFDQGPLTDQPAFVPDSDSDDAIPPPIARQAHRAGASFRGPPPPPKEEKLSTTAGPGVQDRWAQIRKNAAERAAQRERLDEPTRAARTKSTRLDDDGDDTSGEESIENRVARIKARVAELTGSMEGVHGPGSPGNQSPARSVQPASPLNQ